MLSCLQVLSINTSICFVHLQPLLKITPKWLCICTGDSEISLNAKHVHWMILYQICVFGADLKFNMAARVHNVLSLDEIYKTLSETTKPIELLLCRKDHLGGPVLNL
jgi:hypothetical protein